MKASYSQTWDAVVAAVAARNNPLRVIDPASGRILTERMIADRRIGKSSADCGVVAGSIIPTFVSYRVSVQGDSVSAAFQATARWTNDGTGADLACISNGTWEAAFESEVRAKVESRYDDEDSLKKITAAAHR